MKRLTDPLSTIAHNSQSTSAIVFPNYFDSSAIYDYSSPLEKRSVLVCLLDRLQLHKGLAHSIQRASDKYGFTFREGLSSLEGDRSDQYIIRHLIIVDGVDQPRPVTERYREIFSGFTSATLAMTYSSRYSFAAAAAEIQLLKQEYGPSLNYLLPTQHGDGYLPSMQKLVDNSICDSVRIKYLPHKLGDLKPIDIPSDVIRFFGQVSALIQHYRLYHRSQTDGFISLRRPNGSFYITCTKTSKVDLDFRRVALVHGYDRANNQLIYSGTFLPSSDSVEAATVYKNLPWVTSIVHTHASVQFTRNPKYAAKIAVPPASYGEVDLGDRISEFVERTAMKDFVIMEDHGELFFSSEQLSLNAFGEIYACIYKESDSNRGQL